MEPRLNTDYPLQLGASLLGKRTAQGAAVEEYCTLRYDFKPASAGRASQGQMEVQASNQVCGAGGGGGGWRQPCRSQQALATAVHAESKPEQAP